MRSARVVNPGAVRAGLPSVRTARHSPLVALVAEAEPALHDSHLTVGLPLGRALLDARALLAAGARAGLAGVVGIPPTGRVALQLEAVRAA